MKKVFFVLLLFVYGALPLFSQESQTAYNFLRLPVSAHSAALGGDNITLIEDDGSLVFHNPALLSTVSDKTLNLNYMNYMSGANTASALFNKVYKERTSFAVAAQYVDYGKMKEVDENNVQTGEFGAKDIALSGSISYMLTDRIAGGITAKFITSYIGRYNSIAMGVDLGLNYYDSDKEWSVSIVAKNLGGQLKAYNEKYEKLPIDVQIGASKRIEHTPFRLSATFTDFNHLNYALSRHLAVGCDVLLSQSIWVGAGYNFRRAHEMKTGSTENASSHGAGLSLGAGVSLERFKLHLAYGKYHVSSSSILVNIGYTL